MALSEKQIKDILIKQNYVAKKDMDLATEHSKKNKVSLTDYLFSENILTKDIFGQAIAEYYKVPFVDFAKQKIDETIFSHVPELVASSHGVIAFASTEDGVKVAMTNPEDLEIRHFLAKSFGHPILPYYMTPKDLANALTRYRASLREEFKKILDKLKDQSLEKEERDNEIVKVVDILLQYGYENKASDIHIEPYLDKVGVRFRIDGIMHDVLDIPKELSDFIISRIKILAKMRTDEHRAAQDGKLRYESDGEIVDVRVSVLPVTEGENIVMRLLSAKSRRFSLTDLGFSEKNLQKVKENIKNPHGMILVTGPTGSGKTTTLYAVLKILNRREVHISTIEDPVEYDLAGVSQIQVNAKTNLTFAKGLRAIVRQDPDIIMVGEIRDEETAGIAVNSALTGHLVLSTLHTNDAATTLPRLLDMSVEPFLVASTVNVVIAQRLVRKLCEKCRVSSELTKDEKLIIENDKKMKEVFTKKGIKDINKVRCYRSTGCSVCGNTGFSGRVGVFEVLEMAENIKELILKRASSDEIHEAAKKNGMATMFEDGVDKVLNGVTTLDEVLRVAKE